MAKPKVEITTTVKFSALAKKRLTKLAKLLREDAKQKKGLQFDMGTFCDTKDDSPKVDCGTRACAFGLAAISGEFKRTGLGYKMEKGIGWDGEEEYEILFSINGKTIADPYAVAARVFDIPEEVATWLFGGNAPNKKRGSAAEIEMAEIIEEVVKGNLPEEVVEELLY